MTSVIVSKQMWLIRMVYITFAALVLGGKSLGLGMMLSACV